MPEHRNSGTVKCIIRTYPTGYLLFYAFLIICPIPSHSFLNPVLTFCLLNSERSRVILSLAMEGIWTGNR